LFENTLDVDISNARYLFNNVFSGIFTDTTDIYNARKNYNIDNIGPKWIAWIYKRDNPWKILDTDTSSYQIYKDITWKEIPQSEDAIYIIYQ